MFHIGVYTGAFAWHSSLLYVILVNLWLFKSIQSRIWTDETLQIILIIAPVLHCLRHQHNHYVLSPTLPVLPFMLHGHVSAQQQLSASYGPCLCSIRSWISGARISNPQDCRSSTSRLTPIVVLPLSHIYAVYTQFAALPCSCLRSFFSVLRIVTILYIMNHYPSN